MKCPKCGSKNVNVQVIPIVKNKHHGVLYWICFGWFIDLMLWIFLTIPRLIVAIFRPKGVKTKVKSYSVCQNCGYKWKI